MLQLTRAVAQLCANSSTNSVRSTTSSSALKVLLSNRLLSTKSSNSGDGLGGWGDIGGTGDATGRVNNTEWGNATSWSTGLTNEHIDGIAVGRQINEGEAGKRTGTRTGTGTRAGTGESYYDDASYTDEKIKKSNELVRGFLDLKDGWDAKLMRQVLEPGARGSYLKNSEKAEMYKLHKENPEVYTIEKLAKDYRIMRQRVHAILWLKECEEEEEKKLGRPLDDSVEILLDNFSEFFVSHDREFHVASLPYNPEFKVMPEGWDGTTRDPDEVHYEISMKEDEWLYQDFVQKMNFNKMKMAGQVKCHKYSRRRPPQGWTITVEKMGKRGKRGNGGGWKFVSLPDGSTRPLNEMEKMFLKRETPRRRRKLFP